jgi:hypothetical protein
VEPKNKMHITEKQYTTDHKTNHIQYTVFPVMPEVALIYQDIPHNFTDSTIYYKVHDNIIQNSPKA